MLLLWLIACPAPRDTVESDTEIWIDNWQTVIDFVDLRCDDGGDGFPLDHVPANDVLTLDMRNGDVVDGMRVTLSDSMDPVLGRWQEVHEVTGASDTFTVVLSEVASDAPVEAGQTRFNCAWAVQDADGTYGNLAVRFETVDDCVIFGHRSEETFGRGCACAEEWLNPVPDDPCGS